MRKAGNIAFHDIAIDKNRGWFFNIGYNAILRVDIESGNTELEAIFPDHNDNIEEAFAGIEYYDDKLYLAPRNDFRLCVYCLEEKTFRFLDLDTEAYGEEFNYNLFNTVKVIGEYIYFFPGRFHAIVKLDPKNLTLEYIDFGYVELSKLWSGKKDNLVIFNRIHIYDNKCVMPCWRTNTIVEFDLETKVYWHNQLNVNGELADAEYENGHYICSFKNENYILEYNLLEKKANILFYSESNKGNFILSFESKIFVIPIFGDYIEVFDRIEGKKSVVYQYSIEKNCIQEWMKYKNSGLCNKLISGDKLMISSIRTGDIVTIDLHTNIAKNDKIRLGAESEVIIKDVLRHIFSKQMLIENSTYGLNEFLNQLIVF
jgi:hypothetical protein